MNLNPLPLIEGGLSTAGAFLGGIQTYLIVGAVTALLAGSAGAYAGWRWEHSNLLALKLDAALAQAAAVKRQADSDRRQSAVDVAAAFDEAFQQGKLQARTIIIKERIPVHVTAYQDATVCVPVGLLRIMRAAATGADPDTIPLAAGQSDDDCAAYAVSDVARLVAEVYAVGHANAQQLNALQKWAIDNHEAQGETHAGLH